MSSYARWPRKRRKDVRDREHRVLPDVGDGIFQVEHHARRAGVQHLHHELAVIGRACHLIALVLAPGGKLDAPVRAGCVGRRQVIRQLALMRRGERSRALLVECALSRREMLVEGVRNSMKPFGRSRAASNPGGAEFMAMIGSGLWLVFAFMLAMDAGSSRRIH